MRYLHFTNWTDLSETHIGMEMSTSWKVSNYWKGKFEGHAGLSSAFRDGSLDLSAFFKAAKEAGELIKEFVFEQVRADDFSDKPTRRRCMFLLPANSDPDRAAAYLNFEATHYGLIEVEPIEGAFHLGDMEHLTCCGQDYATMAAKARDYWTKPPAEESPSGEVLYCGTFKIIRLVRTRRVPPALP